MLAIRTIPTIPAVFAGRGPRPARRLAQDSPTSPVLRKDWRPAICAVAARIPRYAIARPAGVRTARHQRRQWNWGRRRIHQRFRPRFGLVWRRFAARPLCTVCEIPRIPMRRAMRPWPAFFLDSEQSAESVCSVGTYPVGVRRAPRLMPAMRCAHIRRFFRRSQECSCAPVARCEYASSPA